MSLTPFVSPGSVEAVKAMMGEGERFGNVGGVREGRRLRVAEEEVGAVWAVVSLADMTFQNLQ